MPPRQGITPIGGKWELHAKGGKGNRSTVKRRRRRAAPLEGGGDGEEGEEKAPPSKGGARQHHAKGGKRNVSPLQKEKAKGKGSTTQRRQKKAAPRKGRRWSQSLRAVRCQCAVRVCLRPSWMTCGSTFALLVSSEDLNKALQSTSSLNTQRHITERSCAYCTTRGLCRKCTDDEDASSLKPHQGERLHSGTTEQSTFDDIRATLALNC